MSAFNRTDYFFMTVTTRLFDYLKTVRFYLDVVFVEASREIEGVPESVRGLGRILADKVLWGVTTVAGSDCAVW